MLSTFTLFSLMAQCDAICNRRQPNHNHRLCLSVRISNEHQFSQFKIISSGQIIPDYCTRRHVRKRNVGHRKYSLSFGYL